MKQFSLLVVLSILAFCAGCKKDSEETKNPKACFAFLRIAQINEGITFSAECSEKAETFHWIFGDGGSSTLKNPTHRYTRSGKYKVDLTVFGTDSTLSSTISDSIKIPEPKVRILYGTINKDSTLTTGVWSVIGSVTITNSTLTINPGVTLLMGQNATIDIGINANDPASIQANGTSSQNILITAAGNNPISGYWEGIRIYSKVKSSSLAFCEIAYGGGDSYDKGELELFGSNVSVTNCNFHNSSNFGLQLDVTGNAVSLENNTFSQNKRGPIYTEPNCVHEIGMSNIFDPQSKIVIANSNFTLSAATWKKLTVPYCLENQLCIRSSSGSVLTLEAGVEIQIGNGASILVGYNITNSGSLVAIGTELQPIKFTSSNSNPLAGDWEGMGIYGPQKNGTILKHCIFEYAGYNGINGDIDPDAVIDIRNCGATIENCTFTNYNIWAIKLNGSGFFNSFVNNNLNAPQGPGIFIWPNWVHTIGENNIFNVNPRRAVVVNGGVLSQSNVTWRKLPVAYTLSGDLDIGSESGSTLTIAPGSIIKINGGHFIRIGDVYEGPGALIADGRSDTIRFTNGMNDLQTAPGVWAYIYFDYYTMPGTMLNNCILENGGSELFYGMIHLNYNDNPTIINNIIRNSKNYGISMQRSNPTLSGNVFVNNVLGNINSYQ